MSDTAKTRSGQGISTTYLTLADLSERWQIDWRSIRRLIELGKLPAFRPTPKRVLIPFRAVETYELEQTAEVVPIALGRRGQR